jgi:hypothetical protein
MKLVSISRKLNGGETRLITVCTNGRQHDATGVVSLDGSTWKVLGAPSPADLEAVEIVLSFTSAEQIIQALMCREYGCVRCQTYHIEGDPLFEEHLYFQSKQGIRARPI